MTPDHATEFKERRTRTWRSVRWWLLILAISGATYAFLVLGKHRPISQAEFVFMVTCFLVVAVSMIFLIRGIVTHYRCPNCNEIPMTGSLKVGLGGISYRRAVDLNPTECPNCGVMLK